MFVGKSVLITGGTGSFGSRMVSHLLQRCPEISKIIIYSRDELKQHEMSLKFPAEKHPQLRFFIGDIRDFNRFKRACEGVDVIIHAAAMKQVPASEYNPMECIKTNIFGAENVINAALDLEIGDIIALSTDKASSPVNLYGATKLCSDRLFIAANNMKGKRKCKFSVVRYGNVLGSRGSVVPYFLSIPQNAPLPITHPNMTRFSIQLQQGVEFVLKCLSIHHGGEIFIPKIPSFKILDLVDAIANDQKRFTVVGLRPGEKMDEEMISSADSDLTYDLGELFAILPPGNTRLLKQYEKYTKVPPSFSYNSSTNTDWLTPGQLREQIVEAFPQFLNQINDVAFVPPDHRSYSN